MIREKLSILVASDVIDQETYDYVLKILVFLLKNDIIEDDEEANVFLTHLAMADMRRKKKEKINFLEPFIRAEIEADAKFLESKKLWQDLKELNQDKCFEDAEIDYFYLHLINMLKEE